MAQRHPTGVTRLDGRDGAPALNAVDEWRVSVLDRAHHVGKLPGEHGAQRRLLELRIRHSTDQPRSLARQGQAAHRGLVEPELDRGVLALEVHGVPKRPEPAELQKHL